MPGLEDHGSRNVSECALHGGIVLLRMNGEILIGPILRIAVVDAE